VRRRDFTINGLMMDVETGAVLDFVGGQDDIRAGLVRTIGKPAERFGEDRLRMIRAVRFAARFGYQIDAETFRAIHSAADRILEVSAERLRDELTKLLQEGAARRGFELLDASGLLQVLLPEVARMKGVAQPAQFHPEGDVWAHTLLLLEGLEPDTSPTLAWGALLHDVGKPPTFAPAETTGDRIRFDRHVEVGVRISEAICTRYKFSTVDSEQVQALVANHMRFKDVGGMRPSTLKRFVRLPQFEEHLELHRLDCLASHGMLDNYEFMQRFIRETPAEEVRPARLITGDDLQEMGYKPGPQFREILMTVEEAQLNGALATKDEAMEFVKGRYPV
jgi:poly(A) polymerase